MLNCQGHPSPWLQRAHNIERYRMAIQLGGSSFMQQTSPVSGREVPRHSSALLEAIMTAPCNGCPPP
jgi:hypothetical protein